jgi:hypothetical protein
LPFLHIPLSSLEILNINHRLHITSFVLLNTHSPVFSSFATGLQSSFHNPVKALYFSIQPIDITTERSELVLHWPFCAGRGVWREWSVLFEAELSHQGLVLLKFEGEAGEVCSKGFDKILKGCDGSAS